MVARFTYIVTDGHCSGGGVVVAVAVAVAVAVTMAAVATAAFVVSSHQKCKAR
jgi:hypothetical protein